MSDVDTSFTFQSAPGLILVYPHLVAPQAFQQKGKPKGAPRYSASFMIKPNDAEFKAFANKAVEVARAEWPTANLKEEINSKKGWPWRIGDVLADKKKAADPNHRDLLSYMRGYYVVRASTGQDWPPMLSAIDGGRHVEYDETTRKAATSKFRPGMFVLAKINLRAQVVDEEKFITAYLQMVMSTGKLGMEIKMQKSAAEVFAGYQGHLSGEDPTGGEQFPDEPWMG